MSQKVTFGSFFSLIRGTVNFRKVVGTAAFLLQENPSYLGHVQVSC